MLIYKQWSFDCGKRGVHVAVYENLILDKKENLMSTIFKYYKPKRKKTPSPSPRPSTNENQPSVNSDSSLSIVSDGNQL